VKSNANTAWTLHHMAMHVLHQRISSEVLAEIMTTALNDAYGDRVKAQRSLVDGLRDGFRKLSPADAPIGDAEIASIGTIITAIWLLEYTTVMKTEN
jgi:hypothetical protein